MLTTSSTPSRSSIKALFFPWSHGVGFGYVARALKIAEELRSVGYDCVFGCDTREGIVARSGFEVVSSADSHGTAVPDMGGRRGDYIPLDNLDTVFAITRYYHPSRIMQHVKSDGEIIDTVKPDVVIIDLQPTAAIAARLRQIPLVSVADSDFLRNEDNSWMPWLPPEEACILPYPSCLKAFNEVLDGFGLKAIRHVSDLLWGDLTLLASTPELEANQPPIDIRGPMEFVGPIFWDPPWSDVDSHLEGFGENSDCKIFVALGHGGKVSSQVNEVVLQGCSNEKWSTFISLGFRPPEQEFRLSSPNCRVGGFTGISKPIAWSDIVISHGGYSTVLTALLLGRPSIIIPFMSEQEANGILFTEKWGAGFVLRRTYRSSGSRHFEYRCRYSGLSHNGTFDAEEVHRAVTEIQTDTSFRRGALTASMMLQRAICGRSFLDLIERVLK